MKAPCLFPIFSIMRIQKHPDLDLWCREDGAICMPPHTNCINPKYHKFRWTFGCPDSQGYSGIRFRGKLYKVHRLIAQTFLDNPLNLSTVDHVNRIKTDNRVDNLRWANHKMQEDNKQSVEDSLAKYGTRACEDRKAYNKAHDAAYYAEHREQIKAKKAAYHAKQRALGKHYRHCPDGSQHYLTDSEYNEMFGINRQLPLF